MVDEVGVVVLAELDPSRRAGGYHGQHAAVLDPVDELVGLLHDGHVRAEVGVEHLVKAQAAKGRGHLALHVGANGQAELLAKSRANGGGGLHDDYLLRVVDGVDNVLGVVPLGQSPGGAADDALAAGHAGHVAQGLLEGAAYLRVKAAVIGADNGHVLILARGHAAAAEHALCVVALKILGGEVLASCGQGPLKAAVLLDAHVVTQLLQLAVAAALAGQALALVDGEQQLQGHLPGLLDLGGVGEDLHPLVHRVHAGGAERPCPLHLHHAHAAGANLVYILQIAQRGDVHPGVPGGLKYS